MNRIRTYAVSLTAITMCLAVATVPAEDTEQRRQSAHVHGMAHMTLAAEGNKVLIELTSPAASLIGFERAPRTDDERATLALATENLEAGDAMIRLNIEAGCRLETAEIDAGFADSGQGREAKHAHDHDADQGADGHADFVVHYSFVCDRPEALGSAALGLFSGFPALERVLFQYVTAEGQGGAELTPRAPVVTFVPL
ncbi:DUF2796 domain-containing protein [Thiocapsa roseopersicina]|uniref:DUF2796 domain-containing protein n=1 Tax=Thiocapsa roseopersicina TaxID=1058 RepID=A0A1H2ZNF8_THIRO|nr:DUF2796 domain-containing protein [Thiocapsa roseopersicina]SDX19062.1 Protein of unknown function [Thiocapsa roseopersicina]